MNVEEENDDYDYHHFLTTLWDTTSVTNEEDEEDGLYIPPKVDVPENDDDDDDLVDVKPIEVRELVNGCFEMMVGHQQHHHTTHTTHSNEGSQPLHTKSTRGLSQFVNQIFKMGTSSDICIEGLPVNTIRKIVARQMSMAIQLLVQILLLSCSPDIEMKCFSNMMEISNLRESILKKAHVLQMTIKNISHYQRSKQIKADNNNNNNSNDDVCNTPVVTEDVRITRSYKSTDRCYSIFDIPCLSQGLTLFFSEIDTLRKECQSSITTCTTSNISKFEVLQDKLPQLMTKLQMHTWKCLLPDINYPMTEEQSKLMDPSSILGRMKFTPAEDDLLLRGVVFLGNYLYCIYCIYTCIMQYTTPH
jgi:hypothetical protein